MELERATPRRAFLLSTLTGFLFFLGTVGWVGHVTLPGMLVLAAYLALYFGVWGWIAHKALRKIGVRKEGSGVKVSLPSLVSRLLAFLSIPAAWVALEFVRSFLLSGFGWNLLAHTQWNWIRLIQIADVTGVWGVSFLVVWVNVAAWKTISDRPREEVHRTDEAISKRLLHSRFGFASRSLTMTLICFVPVLSYGTFQLRQLKATRSPPAQTFKVALAQGNIPQTQKWDTAFQEAIWKRYEQLTAEAAAGRPDLIVWPETAVPGFLEDAGVRDRLGAIVQGAGTSLLVGVPTQSPEGLFNSAVLLAPDGRQIRRYNKIHLVPFGEFIPFKPVLGWLENFVLIGDFSAGREYTVFSPDFPIRPFSVLICFEDIFPGISRRFVQAGADGLLVLTNDGWFGRSAASLQHLQCSVFRAVEGRVWVGRAANTGWTGFVDPAGRRQPPPGQIARFNAGIAMGYLPAVSPLPSAYVRWGDWFPWFCLGLAAWALFPLRRRL